MEIITVDDDIEFYSKLSRLPYITILISIPAALGQRIQEIQTQLRSIDDRQVYHHPSYFHITIKGIGWLGEEIQQENLAEIKDKVMEVASDVKPFALTLKGLKVWPTVIYADVLEGRSQVREMHLKMREEPKGYEVTDREYEGERLHLMSQL